MRGKGTHEESFHPTLHSCPLTLGIMPVPDPGERGVGQPAEEAAGLGRVVQAAHDVLCVVARKEKGRRTEQFSRREGLVAWAAASA